jgi:hypothetical protein
MIPPNADEVGVGGSRETAVVGTPFCTNDVSPDCEAKDFGGAGETCTSGKEEVINVVAGGAADLQ